ncbi:MAG: ETC complex I subunit, partial [Pseudomonadota bacterium]
MLVRIYQPAKTAMQSGRAKTGGWVLEPDDASARAPDPLMGWISSDDTLSQIKLRFDSKEDAIAFAQKRGLPYVVQEP